RLSCAVERPSCIVSRRIAVQCVREAVVHHHRRTERRELDEGRGFETSDAQRECGGALNDEVDKRTDRDRTLASPIRNAGHDLSSMTANELRRALAIGSIVG